MGWNWELGLVTWAEFQWLGSEGLWAEPRGDGLEQNLGSKGCVPRGWGLRSKRGLAGSIRLG